MHDGAEVGGCEVPPIGAGNGGGETEQEGLSDGQVSWEIQRRSGASLAAARWTPPSPSLDGKGEILREGTILQYSYPRGLFAKRWLAAAAAIFRRGGSESTPNPAASTLIRIPLPVPQARVLVSPSRTSSPALESEEWEETKTKKMGAVAAMESDPASSDPSARGVGDLFSDALAESLHPVHRSGDRLIDACAVLD
ncbi:hypothetical protein PR202_ga18893 [Eleusine coracana subsp. coracana]|uniref:Uncharacterized protein n=1 Tax=Eleusine coracana subsp. coracana TaxID=191504 RepID=A0AAV5CTY9_ELECO|nr:hypothetical protein PR202_ga18893 [Eleusine coracana subsp. coracana]